VTVLDIFTKAVLFIGATFGSQVGCVPSPCSGGAVGRFQLSVRVLKFRALNRLLCCFISHISTTRHSYVSPYCLWSSTTNIIPISLQGNNYNMAFKAVPTAAIIGPWVSAPFTGTRSFLQWEGEGRAKCCYRVNVLLAQSRALGSCGQNVMGFSHYRLILKGWVSSNVTGSYTLAGAHSSPKLRRSFNPILI
jgi:hypothetical protein